MGNAEEQPTPHRVARQIIYTHTNYLSGFFISKIMIQSPRKPFEIEKEIKKIQKRLFDWKTDSITIDQLSKAMRELQTELKKSKTYWKIGDAK